MQPVKGLSATADDEPEGSCDWVVEIKWWFKFHHELGGGLTIQRKQVAYVPIDYSTMSILNNLPPVDIQKWLIRV